MSVSVLLDKLMVSTPEPPSFDKKLCRLAFCCVVKVDHDDPLGAWESVTVSVTFRALSNEVVKVKGLEPLALWLKKLLKSPILSARLRLEATPASASLFTLSMLAP